MKALFIILFTLITLSSCTSDKRDLEQIMDNESTITIRGKSISSNIVIPINLQKKNNIYKKGDTVWVHIETRSVSNGDWKGEDMTGRFQRFVID